MATHTHFVQIVEPSSGRLRILCLYEGISEAELSSIYYAAFEQSPPTVGFTDEKGTSYPFSLLWKHPQMFSGAKLISINEVHLPSASALEQLGFDSEGTLLTEEHVKQVFQALDQNSDDFVHKEEFIHVATSAFEKLLDNDDVLAFAFQFVSPEDLAVAAATSCYHAQSSNTYFLQYDDFCAWYISSGFDPVRDLTVRAMGVLMARPVPSPSPEQNRSGPGGHLSTADDSASGRMRRSKSRPNLDLTAAYDDASLSTFFEACRDDLRMHPHQAADLYRELKALPRVAGRLAMISRQQLVVLLLKHAPDLDPASPLLHTLLDLLGLDVRVSCPLGHVVSIIALVGQRHDKPTFDAVFQCNQDQAGALAGDALLYFHASMVFRVIFYFCPLLQSTVQCGADQLAQALFIKLLLCAEVRRKAYGKLTLEEFVETFAHALRVGLQVLRIESGYFMDVLTGIVGYANVPTSPTAMPPVVSAPGRSSLEDADEQIAGIFVSYNGAAVSVREAREALGLFEYTAYDVVKYLSQLAESQSAHQISVLALQRGVLRLVADYYVNQSVLQRSVADFIVDRVLATLDPEGSGRLNVVDVCIALMLFCEDDDEDYDRVLVMLALVRHKVLKFSVVVHVAVLLFKTCYALDPSDRPERYLAAAHSDATAFCLEFFMRECASGAADPSTALFSHAQFVGLVRALFVHLDGVSELRKTSTDEEEALPREESGSEDDADNRLAGVQSFSDSEDEDERSPYLDDANFPPSSTALELRAASCMLGLEGYSPDNLLDQLGGLCHAGRLNAKAWAKWFSQVVQQAAGISDADLDMAMHLGNQVFAAFASKEKESVEFSALCPGLAMMCGQTPLEDRLMVAFTVVDDDCDGFISFAQLTALIKSVLMMVTMCSRLASRKVVAMEVSLHELAVAAATEGYSAANMRKEDDLGLETFCDLADDFLKLASVV